MKYMRRSDIGSVKRVEIAIQAYLGKGVYGAISAIAREYETSRLFVYQLLWQLMLIFEIEKKGEISKQAQQRAIDQEILLLRLEGKCSLSAISEILKQQGLPNHSIGHISARLSTFAQAIPKAHSVETKISFYLSDEIFANGQPILVTVDPKSLAILRIELASSRDGESWKKHWQALTKAGYFGNEVVVGDMAKGIRKGAALMGITHHPDLFHLLQGIAIFATRFERQAYAAIEQADERLKIFCQAKSPKIVRKKLKLYNKAEKLSDCAITLFDNFHYLWQQLKAAFDLFDREGNFRTPAIFINEIASIIQLMQQLHCPALNKELDSFQRAIMAYQHYFERAADTHQTMVQSYGLELVNLVGLAWQYSRQATNIKNYQAKQFLTQEAHHYLAWAQSIYPDSFDDIKTHIFDAFTANVRSSSLVENINSSLRTLINTCRGQVSQDLLNLFAFVHNHRPFLRGARLAKSPMEILSGIPLDKSWLEALLHSVY